MKNIGYFVILFIVISPHQLKSDNLFYEAQNYSAGNELGSIAKADLNCDGHADLIVTNFGSDSVSVLFGDGDGVFGYISRFSTGDGPSSVATGDFNEDTYPDLAVTNYNSNNISILIGIGDGTFEDAINYDLLLGSQSPSKVCTGDFNEDGHTDLVIANYLPSDISIFLGAGDGTFTAGNKYAWMGAEGRDVTVEDYNEDGHADIAEVCERYCDVVIFLGLGDGTFDCQENCYDAGDGPSAIINGDFNSDGHIDLAVVNSWSDNVSILMGIGDGTFISAVNYNTGDGSQSIASGDYDKDGYIDLAVANPLSDDISILLGVGDGTFSSAVYYGAGDYPTAITTGDFNEDSYSDLATSNWSSGDVSILINAVGDLAAAEEEHFDYKLNRLFPNYPNPFNPNTAIKFSVQKENHIHIAVYDILGHKVSVLIDKIISPGEYEVRWNGKNSAGKAVASGVYIAEMRSGEYSSSMKMVLIQ